MGGKPSQPASKESCWERHFPTLSTGNPCWIWLRKWHVHIQGANGDLWLLNYNLLIKCRLIKKIICFQERFLEKVRQVWLILGCRGLWEARAGEKVSDGRGGLVPTRSRATVGRSGVRERTPFQCLLGILGGLQTTARCLLGHIVCGFRFYALFKFWGHLQKSRWPRHESVMCQDQGPLCWPRCWQSGRPRPSGVLYDWLWGWGRGQGRARGGEVWTTVTEQE